MSEVEETKTAIENKEADVISEEELDFVADTAIAILKDMLSYFSVGNVVIDEYEGEEGELILNITGDDTAVLIGRHGKTLESIQFLVSAILVRKLGYRFPVVIDVESYKERQRVKLERLARSSAERAIREHRNIKMRPMTPYERRIVHMALRDDNRVETESEDEGSARHVVIFPVK